MEITVTIRNLSPIFSAAPGVKKIALDGTTDVPQAIFPLTRARTMTVIGDSGEGALKTVRVPIVPGNTMRNLLRRSILKAVVEPALKGRAKLSIGAYAAAYAGNASGNPDGVPSSFDEIARMRQHPFIGLFGGGPRMLKGRLMVESLYPVHVDTQRLLGEGFENMMASGVITNVVWTRRVDPICQLGSEEDVEVIEGGATAANIWLAELTESTKAAASKRKKKGAREEVTVDEVAESGGRGLQAFNAHEVVIPGLSWVWRIALDNPTRAQVGAVLMGLSNLTDLTIAGGHAKGYGKFVIDDITLDGSSVWQSGDLADSTCEYVDALAEAADALGAEDFEAFAASAKSAA